MKDLKNKLKKTGKAILKRVQLPAMGIGVIIGINIANLKETKDTINSYDSPSLKISSAKMVSEKYMNKGLLYKTLNLASYFNASQVYINNTEK